MWALSDRGYAAVLRNMFTHGSRRAIIRREDAAWITAPEAVAPKA
jgi:hypothetical protein